MQRDHGVRQRKGRVAGSEWDKKREWRGGLHDTQRAVCQGLSVLVHSTTNVSWLSPSLPLFSLLPSLWLTLSLSLLLSPLFVLLSFFLFQLNEKECVWQSLATNSTWPHMHFHKNRNRVGLNKEMDRWKRDLHSLIKEISSSLTDEAVKLQRQK